MAVKSLKANFAINVLGALVPLAVALVTVPIYIHHIGAARYGVLSIVWVLLGYFGFLDLGLSRAAANALAKLRDAPQAERARVLVTTMVLNFGLGLVGSVCLALAGSYLLQHVLAVPDALKPEIALAFPWIVALFPLALISGVGIGALESREKFLLANVLQMSGMSLGQIVPVILAVVASPSLAVVIPAAAIARALTVITILVVVHREEGPLHVSAFDRRAARRLLSYGSWVTVSGVISPLLVSLDQFVIGSVLGVSSVAHYAVPMNLVTRSQVFPTALTRTLFPRMSNAGRHEARSLASRAIVMLSYSYTVLCATSIILTPIFFRFWIDADFAQVASPVAIILFFGAWMNGLAFIPFEFLQSQGRPDLSGKFHVCEVLPFVCILWGASTMFGIIGAAAAWTFRCTIDFALLLWASGPGRQELVHISLVIPILVFAGLIAVPAGSSLPTALFCAISIAVLASVIALVASPDLRFISAVLSKWLAYHFQLICFRRSRIY